MPTVPTTNPPVILRNRQLASRLFGSADMGQPLTAVPKSKYMFFARFVANPDAVTIYPWLNKLDSPSSGVSFKVKTVDKPKVELTAIELNQYNRKRWAYTKVEYQPVNLRMFDTVDNLPLKLWRDYFTYYFGDSRANKSAIMNNSPVDSTFVDGTGWGLRPITEDLCMFSRLELYSFFGKKYTQTTYLNPKITTIDWQQYDSSSSDPDDMSMTIRYEAIEYKDEAPITAAMAEMFGFNSDTKVIEPDSTIAAPNYFAIRERPTTGYNSVTYANNNAIRNQQSILSSMSSVVTQFGLNSATYYTLQQEVAMASAVTTTFVPNTPTTSSPVVYSNQPYESQSILGIPNNSLPRATIQISGTATMTSLPAFSSSLSIYGSFNFGSF